ncbi:protein-disulfide reductase DsbD domain-containing protein [Jannaschia rubra]|uniref:protein-disulfide reductase DsbD domain-containing protein n=1 Tax=Jannaschia rubra TaxID=282197 RepID=UPI002491127B|nr:protein-disulfide reductase DsbD domain-containing protein [Jannaschia rubra]
MPILTRFLFLCLTLILSAPIARAQMTDVSQAIAVEVLPGWRRADGVHVAALRVRLAPGWKTYWRSAGAAGISPQMDWRASGNVRSVTPAWPTPGVFGQTGALSIGYDRDFVLPLMIAVDGGATAQLRGTLDIGVCADICLPARVRVTADLPASARLDAADAVIEAALGDRPRRVDVPARCAVRPLADGLDLAVTLDVPPQGGTETAVIELPDPAVWVTDATVRRSGGRLEARSQVLRSDGRPVAVDRGRVRITVIGPSGAVEVVGCTGTAP